MSWTMGTGLASDRVEWLGDEDDTVDNANGPYELGTEYHIVCVFEPGSVTWYTAPVGATNLGPAKGSFETAKTEIGYRTLGEYSKAQDRFGKAVFQGGY